MSSKINKWHLKVTKSNGSEEAMSDLDFVQNMTSPDQFSESSEEEMKQNGFNMSDNNGGKSKMSQSSSDEKSSFHMKPMGSSPQIVGNNGFKKKPSINTKIKT